MERSIPERIHSKRGARINDWINALIVARTFGEGGRGAKDLRPPLARRGNFCAVFPRGIPALAEVMGPLPAPGSAMIRDGSVSSLPGDPIYWRDSPCSRPSP